MIWPGNFNSQDSYILDSVARESTVPVFGAIAVLAKYVPVAGIEDMDVRAKFETSDEPQTAIVEVVRSVVNGWETTSIWGFEEVEGERRYVRHSLTKKGDQELKLRFVYDFISELEN
ncbi:uncharacterized protein BP5553_00475 [Venustampulla echinocandica]|uniref:Uncharacterized protein n=1 Tax=Venustampulla echinocandica TaxID=2656787 RepID=A0A370TY87_9HELO|nr:uncharacterized protein BP5553_00475 [Venustampulla echinocandica]RDL40496.1 hypothetical protein BP5553_00475 [Venustampulla echinocandica]